MSLRSKNLFALALLVSTFSFEASAGKWPFCRQETLSRTVSGPADYHAVYASIEETFVTLQNYEIRTSDGQVVRISTPPETVNLQDLQAQGRGFLIDLTGVSFPGGATEIQVVEIRRDVVESDQNRIEFANNTSCDLNTPEKLSFYTAAPVPMTNDQRYFIKVQFQPLASIQINVVKTTTRKNCCPHRWQHDPESEARASHDSREPAHDRGNGHGWGHCTPSEPQTTTVQKCNLANKRHLITIVRERDEV